jgi:asparagine synthase (glutamine-hydrolysing)
VLPGAAAWTFRDGALDGRATYFDRREWEEQPALEAEAFYRELRDVASAVFPRYFESRERIAVSLTGGLDTRMILAWTPHAPGALPCYTFGGTYRDSHDVRVARRVAAACGQPHEVIPVGTEFLSRFGHYAERSVYLTDGCVGVDRAADLYVNERAREIAPVRMTGNYGGEVLRGVVAFRPAPPPPGLFQLDVVDTARAAAATYARVRSGHPVSFAVFQQAPWHHYGLLALEETQLALRSPYLDNALVRTAFRAPAAALAGTAVSARLVADGSARLARIRTDRGWGREDGDRLARLSHALITLQRKAEYAWDYGMPRWLARAEGALRPLHPERLFLGRHKFAHYRVWYRDVLAGYVQDVLLDPRALGRPYVDRTALEAVVQGHCRGGENHTTEIHTLLTLELIHRQLLDRLTLRSAP